METGVTFTSTTSLKEGHSLKQYFLMHRIKKQCWVKQYNIQCWFILLLFENTELFTVLPF